LSFHANEEIEKHCFGKVAVFTIAEWRVTNNEKRPDAPVH